MSFSNCSPVVIVQEDTSWSSESRDQDLLHGSFFQSTCCSAVKQSATKCHRCYFSQETSRQLYKIWALKASPIRLIIVKW